MKKYDAIVVGAGCAGSTIARILAEKKKKVLVIDKRNHIGGNAYDYFNEDGIIVHQYGPHIFHTNEKEVFNFVKKYSPFFKYQHKVLGNLDNQLVPIPFNYKSLELTHAKKEAEEIKKLLKKYYKGKARVSIFDLLNHKHPTIKKFGQFVFDKVFTYYTAKQWNIKIKKIDKSVINRVPVVLGYQDTYFSDKYQYMPTKGYTYMFKNMLKHPNIKVELNANIVDHIKFKNKKIYIDHEEFKGKFIYTGAIDELFDYEFGVLPYRSLDIKLNKINKKLADSYHIYLSGRLAEYKYYNMDMAILNAIHLAKKIK